MKKVKFVKGEQIKVTFESFKEVLFAKGWKLAGKESQKEEQGEEEGETVEVDLEKMKLPELKALAAEAGVDLGEAKTVKEIKEVLKAALEQ